MREKDEILEVSRPVFIVGYGHSGTTLLKDIVSNHFEVLSFPVESKFFEYLSYLKSRFSDLSDQAQLREAVLLTSNAICCGMYRALDAGSEICGGNLLVESDFNKVIESLKAPITIGSIFYAVNEFLVGKNGKKRWMEKTPAHIYSVDDIFESIPDVRFLEIVRDPRDVLASKKTRRETVWSTSRYADDVKLKKHYEKAYDVFWDTYSWVAASRSANNLKFRQPELFLTIRYEDLVSDPENIICEICEFIEIKYTPDMLKVGKGVPADFAESRKEGITQQSVSRWRKVLSGAETVICQHLAKKEMVTHGYDPSPVPALSYPGVPFLLLRSSFEIFQRIYKRWRLGGRVMVSNTVRGYWRRFKKL